MSIYESLHRNKVPLCILFITSGIPLVIVSVLGLLYSEGRTGLIQFFNDLLGGWAYWLILIGLMMLIIGLYYLITFIKKLKEFKKLIETPSKAKFLQNLDKIEELAWRLHPKYEKIVINKKREHHIK